MKRKIILLCALACMLSACAEENSVQTETESTSDTVSDTGITADDSPAEANVITIAGTDHSITTHELFLKDVPLTDEDLQKLPLFTDLWSLSIDLKAEGNSITDLSPLSECSAVTHLYISGTCTDLGFLSGMTSLTDLYLRYFDCTAPGSTPNIPENTKISHLDIDESGFENTDWIGSLGCLKKLTMNHLSIPDLDGLSGLNALEEIDISFTELDSVQFENDMDSLKSFSLHLTGDKCEIGSLAGCKNLEKLAVDADVSDLEFLNGLNSLREFAFYGNRSEYDITPLANCGSLKLLDLQCNYRGEELDALKNTLDGCIIIEAGERAPADEITLLEERWKQFTDMTNEYANEINSSVERGIIDFDLDGELDFFVIYTHGNQGYNEAGFYRGDNFNEPLFTLSGFCRDGDTYFGYDIDSESLLSISEYLHSYSIKNQRIDSVLPDGTVNSLFLADWSSETGDMDFVCKSASVRGEDVSEEEYEKVYREFFEKGFMDMPYYFCDKNGEIAKEDGLYLGAELTFLNDPREDLILMNSRTIAKKQQNAAGLSREYEFDPEKYIESHDNGKWQLRDDLDFLNDEQYDTFIRALIFIDETAYLRVPDTCTTPVHWLDDNGNIIDHSTFETDTDDSFPYVYVSDRDSFYDYIKTVFTDESADRIMAGKYFTEKDGGLYFYFRGEKGGPVFFREGHYRLTEKNDDEVIFEYDALQSDDEKDWTETHTIRLINTESGWRCELFEYLYAENSAREVYEVFR